MRKISDAVTSLFDAAISLEFDMVWGSLKFIKIKVPKEAHKEIFQWLREVYAEPMYDPNHPSYMTEVTISSSVIRHTLFQVYPAYLTTDSDDNTIAVFRVHKSR